MQRLGTTNETEEQMFRHNMKMKREELKQKKNMDLLDMAARSHEQMEDIINEIQMEFENLDQPINDINSSNGRIKKLMEQNSAQKEENEMTIQQIEDDFNSASVALEEEIAVRDAEFQQQAREREEQTQAALHEAETAAEAVRQEKERARAARRSGSQFRFDESKRRQQDYEADLAGMQEKFKSTFNPQPASTIRQFSQFPIQQDMTTAEQQYTQTSPVPTLQESSLSLNLGQQQKMREASDQERQLFMQQQLDALAAQKMQPMQPGMQPMQPMQPGMQQPMQPMQSMQPGMQQPMQQMQPQVSGMAPQSYGSGMTAMVPQSYGPETGIDEEFTIGNSPSGSLGESLEAFLKGGTNPSTDSSGSAGKTPELATGAQRAPQRPSSLGLSFAGGGGKSKKRKSKKRKSKKRKSKKRKSKKRKSKKRKSKKKMYGG